MLTKPVQVRHGIAKREIRIVSHQARQTFRAWHIRPDKHRRGAGRLQMTGVAAVGEKGDIARARLIDRRALVDLGVAITDQLHVDLLSQVIQSHRRDPVRASVSKRKRSRATSCGQCKPCTSRQVEPRGLWMLTPPDMLRTFMPGCPLLRQSVVACAIARAVLLVLAVALAAAAAGPAYAQSEQSDFATFVDRPIAEVRLRDLQRVDEQLVRNNIRAAAGDPFDPAVVHEDVRRLTKLGRFESVEADVELLNDGTVAVVYQFIEQPLIAEVQVVGNTVISDQELLDAVRIVRGLPRSTFQIERAKRDIEDLYRKRGHYLATVTVDESELEERGILIFRIIEGPRVKVRAIEFRGNDAIVGKRLRAEIKTETALLFLRRGVIDEDVLAEDVAALDEFYKGRGYLDVRVDRRIELSPDNREAKVVFLIDEGQQYTLGSVRTEQLDGSPLRVFATAQIAAMLEIKRGDVYSRDKLRKSLDIVRDAYGRLGYLDVQVRATELRSGEAPVVDLLLSIDEGQRYDVGLVRISGNFLTKDKVIRREVRLKPSRPFDVTEIDRARTRLQRTRLFNDVRITVQDPRREDPEQRDVLVEVKERNTGSVNFGVAFGSDTGAFGEISIRQDNFDVADTPESLREFITGRSFRGAGQRFFMVFRPGDELFNYSIGLTEPHIFETDYSLSTRGSFNDRRFNLNDETRLSTRFSLGRSLGDVWEFGTSVRAERVELTDIDPFAPTELFDDAGPDTLTGVSLSLTRTTIGNVRRPGRGSNLELTYERVGLLGGDHDFNRLSGSYDVFFTVAEDFLGRKSILKLSSEVGYLFGGDPPTYEQFYLGGRSFRGFDFREVSPKGIRADTGEPSDEPVGGEWMFFLGAQYEFPLFEETVTGVVFVDSGTVTDEIALDPYRLSIGTGVRLRIDALGPVPIAFDFALPILKEPGDDTQVLSFSAELPF